MNLKKLISVDWDAIAGVIAAVTAIVLHFLHIINEEVLLTIIMVLIALLFIRDLRRERTMEDMSTGVEKNRSVLESLRTDIIPPDAVLVGPGQLRSTAEAFSVQARGDMIWFNICLSMYKPQVLFDSLLRTAIENPRVTSIQFILDEGQKGLWESDVVPKMNTCSNCEKVKEPRWGKIDEPISMIISDVGSRGDSECLLSFWGEPFMATTSGRSVPRYIFHVQSHSELMARLTEIERNYRFTGD